METIVQGVGCYKKGGQSTYNVTLRRVRVTIVAVEKQQVLHIQGVFLYP